MSKIFWWAMLVVVVLAILFATGILPPPDRSPRECRTSTDGTHVCRELE